ncbi:hypothetical protein [Microbulbifer sp. GL-2]|uniref:hypothetical protein n=1 Tax=Microbulbifer sp. GL-2 TaxID=2591606 RepID=UPI00116563B4|nr:hypothetical protein [Microbulbifer sp. GL-2]BBL99929.1 hypothetical protein GL2_00040 [Microbulbifer sp. GL-2]
MRILLIAIAFALTGLIAVTVTSDNHSSAFDERVDTVKRNQKSASTPSNNLKAISVVTQDSENGAGPNLSLPSKPNNAAVQSLMKSMKTGDPRTPPLAPTVNPRIKPTLEELASRDLYREFEARQKKTVYASFVVAAKHKITEIEQQIAQGKKFGVSQKQLAEATQKLEMLQKETGRILREHPEIDIGSGPE